MLEMVNCTVSGNTAPSAGGLFFSSATSPASLIRNCIFWDNTPSEIEVNVGTLEVCHSDIEGTSVWPDPASCDGSNINADPLFVNAASGNYRLRCTPTASPCIDAGLDGNVATDVQDVNENSNTGEIAADRDLATRIVPDNSGDLMEVDMGAHETSPYTLCVADFNDDCYVNVLDLLLLIGGWGPCPPPPAGCHYDIGPISGACSAPDGMVNATDLLALIANWGQCVECGGLGVGEGAPASVEDCERDCEAQYPTTTQGFTDCMNRCIQSLCEQQLLPPEDCN